MAFRSVPIPPREDKAPAEVRVVVVETVVLAVMVGRVSLFLLTVRLVLPEMGAMAVTAVTVVPGERLGMEGQAVAAVCILPQGRSR